MRERFYYLLIILLVTLTCAVAQTPVIQKIEPLASFPKTRIIISGTGFSSTPSQLQVWFDQVKGTIISSTDFSIEVEVPAQARLANVTVLNLVSRLSAQSKLKFMPVFSGEGFDPTKLSAPLSLPASSPNAIFDIISIDVDGDNKPDLLGSENETTATDMTLLMNQSTVGNISFINTTLTTLNIGVPTGQLAVGDLNLDGKPDVVASRSGTTSNAIFILINTSTVGNPNFAAAITFVLDIAQGVRDVGIADLNGDGKPEIVVTNTETNNLYIYKNESTAGSLIINPIPIKVQVTGATKIGALELQDMDGDGMTDVVALSFQESDIFVLKNISAGSTISLTNITKLSFTGKGFRELSTADFNKDGKLDIIATSILSDQALVLLNESTTTLFSFKTNNTLTTDALPFGVDVSDLNGDGFPDFIIANKGANTLNAYVHNGNISTVAFTKVLIPTNKTNWFVRAGDLDGDAKPDLAFTSITGTAGPFSIDILRNQNCHKPKILNIPPLTICATQTIRLNTIPIPGHTFAWSVVDINNNVISTIKTSVDPFVDITAGADYMVMATGLDGCSVKSAPLTVQSGAGAFPANPTITTTSPICEGTPLTLSTPTVSGATYSWTGPNNFISIVQNPPPIASATIANAGNYSLTIKVGDCSSNTVTKRVDVVSFGNFSISSSVPSNTICQGQSLTLTVNSQTGYTYQWIKDGQNLSNQTFPTLPVSQGGDYKVNVSNTALNCSLVTNAISVVVLAVPSATFTIPTTGCIDNVMTFTNTSTTDPKATSVVHSWDFGDASTSLLKDPTHKYLTAQTFNSKLTVSYTGITGCNTSISKSINIVTGVTPVITASTKELCADGSETLTLSATGTGILTSYLWSTGEKFAIITVTQPKDYSVETLDETGCKGVATITITEKTNCTPIETEIPPLFTPNGDSQNDRWVIPGIENKGECTMNIFDGRGRRILQKKGYPVEGWDGISEEGKEVPDGTYYYVLSCPDDEIPVTGSVLIVR